MEIKTLHIELEAWATKNGWKGVTELITKHHLGDLLESLDGVTDGTEYGRRTHNNAQIIKRAFRGTTPKYIRHAAMLAPAVRAAMDAELDERKGEQFRVASSSKEHSEVICAVLTGAPLAVIQKEAMESIMSTALLAGLVVQIAHANQLVCKGQI
jgi:hypothetical protein